MLNTTRRLARAAGRKAVTQAESSSRKRIQPARDEMAVEYQNLVAAREATSREMIPDNTGICRLWS